MDKAAEQWLERRDAIRRFNTVNESVGKIWMDLQELRGQDTFRAHTCAYDLTKASEELDKLEQRLIELGVEEEEEEE